MRHAVAHRLDKDRAAPILKGHPASFLGGFADGEDIVSVDADGVDAVAYPATSDPITAVLLQCRCGDRVTIVATDEDHGTRPRCSDVETGVKISFTGRAFAKVARHDPLWHVGVL